MERGPGGRGGRGRGLVPFERGGCRGGFGMEETRGRSTCTNVSNSSYVSINLDFALVLPGLSPMKSASDQLAMYVFVCFFACDHEMVFSSPFCSIALLLYFRTPILDLYSPPSRLPFPLLTLQTTFSPSSIHYPSRDHTDDLYSESPRLPEKPPCTYPPFLVSFLLPISSFVSLCPSPLTTPKSL